MAIYECAKCYPTSVPDDLPPDVKDEVSGIVRGGSRIQAILHLKSRVTSVDLFTAKGIVTHITGKKGYCHHCGTELEQPEGACAKCKRLNLDW